MWAKLCNASRMCTPSSEPCSIVVKVLWIVCLNFDVFRVVQLLHSSGTIIECAQVFIWCLFTFRCSRPLTAAASCATNTGILNLGNLHLTDLHSFCIASCSQPSHLCVSCMHISRQCALLAAMLTNVQRKQTHTFNCNGHSCLTSVGVVMLNLKGELAHYPVGC